MPNARANGGRTILLVLPPPIFLLSFSRGIRGPSKRRILSRNFSVGTGSAGRRGRVEAERAVATLAHRRGRAGAGAL